MLGVLMPVVIAGLLVAGLYLLRVALQIGLATDQLVGLLGALMKEALVLKD